LPYFLGLTNERGTKNFKFNFHIIFKKSYFSEKKLLKIKKEMKFLINNFRNLNGDFKYSLTFTRFTKKGYELLIYDNFYDQKKP
jgi:hypothetical protein